MIVTAHYLDGDTTVVAPLAGPPDLYRVGPGVTVVVAGSLDPSDVTRWSAALGAAVLRGAEVRRRP